jgi:hypothetical protein
VLATTVRLWIQRRRHRALWRVIFVTALVAVVFAAGAITVGLARGGQPPGRAAGGHSAVNGQGPAGAAALAAAAATRSQAAAWAAAQVSPDAIVACDPAMCAALQHHGLAAGRLLALGAGRPDPLGSDLVVATAAVRSLLGARLAGVYAPVTLASFGSGTAQISIRAVAVEGSAAYRTALAADQRARQAAGAQLLRNPRIHLPPAARSVLAAGGVDSRLLVTLATLAALHPLTVVRFGALMPGASAGVPVSAAVIRGARGPHGRKPAGPRALRAFLAAQRPPYRPRSLRTVRIAPGRDAVAVQYPVPGPLGLLGPRG